MYRLGVNSITGASPQLARLMYPDIGEMPSVPALSATSDLPEPAAPAPEPPAADPAPDAGEGDDDAGGDGSEPPAPTPEPPALRRSRETAQDRVKEAVAGRRDAEARADRLTESLERAVEALSKYAPQQQPPTGTQTASPHPAAPRPTRDQFDDPDAYDSALVDWSTRTAAAVASAEVERRLAEQKTADDAARTAEQTRQKFEQVQSRFAEKQAALAAKPEYSDFSEVALNPDLTVTEHMTPAILEAENGPDVLYHLGKNPDEAARIAALPPMRQIIEIGRLSARLEAPVAPPPRRLPPPIDPLNGNRNPADKTETDAEFFARRERELQSARRASMWGRPAPAQ